MLYFKKMINRLVIVLFLLTTLFSNINYGLTNNKNPISSGISTPGVSGALAWNSVSVSGKRVWYPEDNWQQYDKLDIAFPTQTTAEQEISFTRSRHGASMSNRQGVFSGAIGGDLASEARAMNATQMTKTIEQLTEEEVVIVGRYSQQQGMGVIFGFKVHKKQNENNAPMISVETANFTPYHGQRWVINRSYLSDYEKANTNNLGHNPFIMHTKWNNEVINNGRVWNNSINYGSRLTDKSPLPTGDNLDAKYKNDTDPTFYNISWEKFQVAIGHAMRYWNANAAYMTTSSSRITSKNIQRNIFWFFKIAITEWYTHIKPTWYVALSSQAQDGEVAYACVLLDQSKCYYPNSQGSVASESTVKSNHIATSGVAVTKWSGGGFFDDENPKVKVHWTAGFGVSTLFFFVLSVIASVALIAFGGPLWAIGFTGLGAILLFPRGGINVPRVNIDPNAFKSLLKDIFPAPSFYPTGVSIPSQQIYSTLNADPLTNQKLSERQLDDILIKILYPFMTGHVGNGTLVNYNGSREFLNYGIDGTPSKSDLRANCETEIQQQGDANERLVRMGQCAVDYLAQLYSPWNDTSSGAIQSAQRTLLGMKGNSFCDENQSSSACNNKNDAGLIMRRDNISADKNAAETKMLQEQKKNEECRSFLGTLERPTKGQMEEFYKCMRGE